MPIADFEAAITGVAGPRQIQCTFAKPYRGYAASVVMRRRPPNAGLTEPCHRAIAKVG